MAQVKFTALLTTALFLIAAGTVSNGWQMYFMAAVILSLPAASYLVGRLTLRGLRARRELPSPAWAGDVVPFRLTVTAEGRWPRMFMQVTDDLPKWLRRAEDIEPTLDFAVSGEARAEYGVETLKRGVYTLSTVSVSAADPLGLFRFKKTLAAPGELTVYPVPEEIPGLAISGAERYGFRDLPFTAARGSGVDMDGVREYVPGDPLRRMHWKTVARTGNLHVIEFEESRSQTVVVVLDTFLGGDIGTPPDSSFEYLVRTAASLAQRAVRDGACVRMVCGEPTGMDGNPGRGTEHLLSIYGALARSEARSDRRLSSVLASRLGVLHAGTTVIILTADPDPLLGEAIASYTAAGLAVIVLYADGGSWRSGRGTAPRRPEDFMIGLFRAGAEVLVMQRTANMRLMPEPVWSLADA
ncbi:MAG: DUF58 domain-containing protein [Chthonomonadales bacterium]|nr:DUF58 domain-containing protein [Chthonomonadales bacterium]